MDDYQGWELIDELVYKGVSQWQIFICQNGQSSNRIPIFSLQINSELFLLTSVDAHLKQITTQEILRQNIIDFLIVRSWWSDHPIIFLLPFFLPPEEKFNHPVECLRFDKEEADVLTVSFDDRRCVEQSYIVQFLSVYSHYLESLGLLSEIINSCQCLLDLVGIGQHLFHEVVVLLYIFLFDLFVFDCRKTVSDA